MNNIRDFVEILGAALLCATGGVLIVRAFLAIEKRRAMATFKQVAEPAQNSSDTTR